MMDDMIQRGGFLGTQLTGLAKIEIRQTLIRHLSAKLLLYNCQASARCFTQHIIHIDIDCFRVLHASRMISSPKLNASERTASVESAPCDGFFGSANANFLYSQATTESLLPFFGRHPLLRPPLANLVMFP